MTCSEYLNALKGDYDFIRKLSNKNGARIILLKHKTLGTRLVLRQYETPVLAYDFLKTVKFENLPLVFDTVTLDDGQLVFEEYIDGITVADVLENAPYTYSGARAVVASVCDALALVHEAGLVHRDIKPENIMLSREGTVKLIDFNAARRVTENAERDTVQIGTVGYAPPEQLGLAQSDSRTDIYALGVLLNVMLTGVHPSKRLADGRAGKIILKCTRIDPSSRYQSVNELKKAL